MIAWLKLGCFCKSIQTPGFHTHLSLPTTIHHICDSSAHSTSSNSNTHLQWFSILICIAKLWVSSSSQVKAVIRLPANQSLILQSMPKCSVLSSLKPFSPHQSASIILFCSPPHSLIPYLWAPCPFYAPEVHKLPLWQSPLGETMHIKCTFILSSCNCVTTFSQHSSPAQLGLESWPYHNVSPQWGVCFRNWSYADGL